MASVQRHKKTKPLAIDLFSGCGGLTLGLKQAGFQVIGAVDNDPLSVETYKANHRSVRVWQQDLATLTGEEILRELRLRPGELHLLAGCPPCQGFSSMRTLNRSRRIRDQRNDLVFDFLRLAEALRPRALMMENVPGLAKNHRFRVVIRELRKLGYVVSHRVLDTADYGVPQRRRRLVLIGSRDGSINFAASSTKRRTVRDAIGDLPPPDKAGDALHVSSERRSARIATLIRSIPANGGSRRELGAGGQLRCHQRCNGFKDVYGRMKWDSVAPTITTGCVNPSKGRFLHPEAHRAITLREAALIQSFPQGYRFPLHRGKFATAALIGNALPPEFVKRLARPIRDHFTK